MRLIIGYVCVGILALSSATCTAEPLPLRIVSFNAEICTAPGVRAGQLERFRFDYARREHCERVADLIETLNPDILNLAEVTSKEAVDLIVGALHEKGLTQYTGYHVESNDTFTGMDVALVTKYPPDVIDGLPIRTIFSPEGDPTWSQAFSFTEKDGSTVNSGTSLGRNSLYFITVNGWKLGFLGLHLKSNPEDAYSNARRTAEAALAQRVCRGEIVRRGYMPVVLGDLNDYDPDVEDADNTRNPATNVLASIKDFDPARSGAELLNSAMFIPRIADRYSSHWDWNENGAHDAQDVYTMIDHVLLPKEFEPFVKRVFICHSTDLETSDHYPVVVDLELPLKN